MELEDVRIWAYYYSEILFPEHNPWINSEDLGYVPLLVLLVSSFLTHVNKDHNNCKKTLFRVVDLEFSRNCGR
jgi:hypothetical protein